MKKERYVKRLNNMLVNRKDPCGYCPCANNYDCRFDVPESSCKTCQTFAGLKYRPDWNEGRQCPCTRLGAEKAISRAWKNIHDFNNARILKQGISS